MELYEAKKRDRALTAELLRVWEHSVRATHRFLSGPEIDRIKGYVPQALASVEHLIIAENPAGEAAAFMGIEKGRLEMLFLAPEARGNGLGRQLLEYGIRKYGVRELTVNEQNPQAVGFYEHMGFVTCARTETDEQGGPYPLLYMRRTEE